MGGTLLVLSDERERNNLLRLKKRTKNTVNGINEITENITPQNVVKSATEISPANTEGSAVPVLSSSANAPTMPLIVPTTPISGGITTPRPQTKAAHPKNLLDWATVVASNSEVLGGL